MSIPRLFTHKAVYTQLENRGFIILSGVETPDFLQALTTNDIRRASTSQAVHTAFLTPQGRVLFDTIVMQIGEDQWGLEVDLSQIEPLIQHLKKYRLRRKVDINIPEPQTPVYVAFGDDVFRQLNHTPQRGLGHVGNGYADPRLLDLGIRFWGQGALSILESKGFQRVDIVDYQAHRFSFGVPQGEELGGEIFTVQESNLDRLNTLDWKKGCYTGHEVAARVHYKGESKKRLFPFMTLDVGLRISAGDGLYTQSNQKLGKAHYVHAPSGNGLAFMHVRETAEALRAGHILTTPDGTQITVCVPAWFPFPKLTEADIA